MKLFFLLAVLSPYYIQVDGCSAVLPKNAISSQIAGMEALPGLAEKLFYPVDVYPSKCKRNHWQVCTMTEANAVREGGKLKWEICKQGSPNCLMRCASNAMDRNTVREIKAFAQESGAEFNVNRGQSGITEVC